MSKQTETKDQPTPIKRCGIFDIYPALSKEDTFNGKPVTKTSMWMAVHAGEVTLTHKGKEVKINLSSSLDGTTILGGPNRQAKINLKAFLQAAIDGGLLDDKINFTDSV